MEVNQLIEELNKQTEQTISEPVIEDTHFEEAAPAEETPTTEQEPEEQVSASGAKSMAEFMVRMFSAMMKMVFTPLYKLTILEDTDVQRMDEFRKKHAGQTEKQMEEALHSDHAMWPVVNRFDQYMAAVREIGLTKEEQEMIITPLSECIVKYNWKLSPGWMLVVAMLMVMLPRVTRLIPDTNKAEAS